MALSEMAETVRAREGPDRSDQEFRFQANGLRHRPPFHFYAFDLLHLDGRNLVPAPIEERRRLLAGLMANAESPLRLSAILVCQPLSFEWTEGERRHWLQTNLQPCLGIRTSLTQIGGLRHLQVSVTPDGERASLITAGEMDLRIRSSPARKLRRSIGATQTAPQRRNRGESPFLLAQTSRRFSQHPKILPMNRRHFLETAIVAVAGTTLIIPFAQAVPGKVGNLDPAAFKKINKDAGEKVAAIKPTSDPLSAADAKLLVEVALGGMMQLEMSKVAFGKATSADVRAIAEAEVEEQTGLAAKLKEIAAAKGGTLPAELDDKGKAMVKKLHDKTGADFDREYLQESGVHGHQKLNKTMMKVQSDAADATLKTVASTALPLIQTHLQVSKDEMKDLA
jgi:putative membrane protein